MTAFPATSARKDLSLSLLLISPSRETFQELKGKRQAQPADDLELFRSVFATPDSLMSELTLSMGNVVYESQGLREVDEEFDATKFNEMTTFVRLREAGMPGPEYDVPYADRAKMRPKNAQAREAWEQLYEGFRQRRMEVCGLDLEYWEGESGEQRPEEPAAEL